MRNIIILLLSLLMQMPIEGRSQADDYLLPAKKYGRWGFIDRSGQWIIQAEYEEARHFSEGLAAAKYYGSWGFIDINGDWKIAAEYEDVKPFHEGLACAMKNRRWGFIDHDGAWHFEPNMRAVSSFSDGKAIIKKDGGFVFINTNGDRIIKNSFDRALPFAEGLAFVIYHGYKGYIDQRGNWMIKHDYQEAYSFSEGLALVKIGNQYGFIDQQGKIAIEPKYDDANYFKEGLAAVKQHDTWGYINQTGRYVIEGRFDAAFPFSNHLAVVKYGGRFGVIDKQGDWMLAPSYSGLGKYTEGHALTSQIKNYVKSMYADWQLKGEFEKTSEYLKRLSAENKQKKIRQLSIQAADMLAQKRVKLSDARLGLYQADIEKFNVIIPGTRNIMLPVPLELAKEVKENWHDVWLGNAVYTVAGDDFVVNALEARFKGKHFYYNASEDDSPTPISTLDLALDKLHYDMPTLSAEARAKTIASALTIIGQSDVDKDIPVTDISNEKTFALVIGNEDYSSFQMQLNTEVNVDFAAIDAKTFNKYLINTLGVPRDNITLLVNATAGQMRQSIARLSAIAQAYEGEAKLIFYYAGHGLPKENTGEPYLVPVDVSGSNLDYALKLEDVFRKLSAHPSKSVTVFLDACFSGGGRNEGLVAARGVRIKPKSPYVQGNLIVFSATADEQAAHPYREKAHGIFTYYLLKGLQLSKGEMTYGALEDFVRTNVMRKSVLVNNKIQSPEVKVSPAFQYNWQEMRFTN